MLNEWLIDYAGRAAPSIIVACLVLQACANGDPPADGSPMLSAPARAGNGAGNSAAHGGGSGSGGAQAGGGSEAGGAASAVGAGSAGPSSKRSGGASWPAHAWP
jgi:uncharacterized membrane protein YgcG